MSDYLEQLIKGRKKEITLTDDLIWHKVIKNNPPNLFLKLPNEFFLLLSLICSLGFLVYGFWDLKFADPAFQPQALEELQEEDSDHFQIFDSFRFKIVLAFGLSFVFVTIAFFHRWLLFHYNAKIEQKYQDLYSNIKTMEESDNSEDKPSIRLDFSEMTVHFQKLIDTMDQMNQKLDALPQDLVLRSSTEFQSVLEQFSNRMVSIPGELESALNKREVETNEEKTLFRDAVSTFANWFPEFDEIKSSMTDTSEEIAQFSENFEASIDQFQSKLKLEFSDLNQSMLQVSSKISEFSVNINKSTDDFENSLEKIINKAEASFSDMKSIQSEYNSQMLHTNTHLQMISGELTNVHKDFSTLLPLTESLANLSDSVSNHIQSYNDYINQITLKFGKTFSQSMSQSINNLESNVISKFEENFTQEMTANFKKAIDSSSIGQSLVEITNKLNQLSKVTISVNDRIQKATEEDLSAINNKIDAVKSNIERVSFEGIGKEGRGIFKRIFNR
jgi:hypothetical protein